LEVNAGPGRQFGRPHNRHDTDILTQSIGDPHGLYIFSSSSAS
jgi:hypothetical protein